MVTCLACLAAKLRRDALHLIPVGNHFAVECKEHASLHFIATRVALDEFTGG